MTVIPDINFEFSKMKKNPILLRGKYIAEVEWKHKSRPDKKFDKIALIDNKYLTLDECRLGSTLFLINQH